MPVDVYVEKGNKRVFACALDWPGWCRSARDQEAALQALADYGTRYAKVAGGAFKPPATTKGLNVVERLKGDATTDFGAPSIAAKKDSRALQDRELKRQVNLLQACWSGFDEVAKKHARAKLRKGPRGGGREIGLIVSHVLEADGAYLSRIGGSARGLDGAEDLRGAIVETLSARARGEKPPPNPRRTKPLWLPRYAIRRIAWHALDHLWEIEDRAL